MHTVESRILPRCSLNEAMFSFKSIIVLCRSLFFKIFSRRPYSYITETLAYNECMNIFTATAAKKIVMRLGVMEVTCLGQQQCLINLLKPNDIYIYMYIYICRTAALTSRRYIINIYSTNIHTEYFKHAA